MTDKNEIKWRSEFEEYVLNSDSPRDLQLERYNGRLDDYVDHDTHEAYLAYKLARRTSQDEIDSITGLETFKINNAYRDEIQKLKEENRELSEVENDSAKEIWKLKELIQRAATWVELAGLQDKSILKNNFWRTVQWSKEVGELNGNN